MLVIERPGRLLFLLVFGLLANNLLNAADPDVLICKDGEKLVGHLVSVKGSSVVFKSDVVGQVTVDFKKIQELHTTSKFAVIPKGLTLRNAQSAGTIAQGTIAANDQQTEVSPATGAAETLPTANVGEVVDEGAFQGAFSERGFFHGWTGGATAGIAYADSTQTSQTYTAALNLTRADPGVDWLDPRTRTLFNFTEAYGEIKQPGTTTTKTAITHFGFEEDKYFSPRLFLFGQALLDHNYSEGLNLQEDFGGGVGVALLRTAKREFDVKASVDYIDQRFANSSLNQSLIGSTFGETYKQTFTHGIVLAENGDFIPAWNNSRDYSSVGNVTLTFPVYHRFGFTLGGTDNFLNDPPPGDKKNSLTLSLGATYTIK